MYVALSFIVGIVLGAWGAKHPDDVHGYLGRAGENLKKLLHLK